MTNTKDYKEQNIVTKYTELTPVIETQKNIFYKRDDLFEPYSDEPINGGKVRQTISLIENNLKDIKEIYNNTIVTASSIESPQGSIMARVAKDYGLRNILAIGGGTQESVDKLINKHNLIKAAHNNGTEIRAVNKLGYTSVLLSKIKEMQLNEPMFNVMFYINIDDNFDSIIGTTIEQVKNLPLDKINKVIVPVGGALQFSGVILGLHRAGWLKDKNNSVIGIQIANTDRKDTINGILSKAAFMQRIPYTLLLDPTYKYHQHVKQTMLNTDILLDPIYEAKAHEYAIKQGLLKENSLFWVVGNSIPLREKYNTKNGGKKK